MTNFTRWKETCEELLIILHVRCINVVQSLTFFSTVVPNRKALAEKYIMTAAKLIAPAIETSFVAGFDWLVLF